MKNFFARARVYVLIASLSLLAQASRAASPAELIKTFRTTSDGAVRAQARQELVKAGPEAVPALIAEMAHNARGRDALRRVLQDIGPKAAPKLLELTQDADQDVRSWAGSNLLWVVDESSADLMPKLAACAGRGETNRSCLDAMLKISGPKTRKHASAVVKLLSSSDPEARAYACSILGRMRAKGKDVIAALEKAAQDRNSSVKQAAEEALRGLRG